MRKTYSNYDDIEQKILDDYENDDVELNHLFFDFNVEMSKGELLELYADIVCEINGDIVVRLEDMTTYVVDGDREIWGKEIEPTIPEELYDEMYKGNYMNFLQSYNGKELETGLCRFIDCEEKEDGTIGGVAASFIW